MRPKSRPAPPFWYETWLFVGLLSIAGSSAQAAPLPVAMAASTDQAPEIDGLIDEPEWASAPPISNFTQRDPNEGAPATQSTQARILYDDQAVYIAVRAHDEEPSGIRQALSRRDVWTPVSDWITVALATYGDRRTAFEFSVNPAGVKLDTRLFNDTQSDPNWNATWDVATHKDGDGWSAEFRIPLSQLRFNEEAEVWGLQLSRFIGRNAETANWAPYPKRSAGNVSLFGELRGVHVGRDASALELLPYTLGQGATGSDAGSFANSLKATAGFDLKLGVTTDLTLDVTVNPDFGQVESDPAIVNLTAFEAFFEERRPFFIESKDIFEFKGPRMFYTRRIGRAPQRAVDEAGSVAQNPSGTTILGATRLSGKTEGWSIGFLDAITAKESAVVVDADGTTREQTVEPQTNYLALRLLRDLRGGATQIGVLGTVVNRSLPTDILLPNRAFTLGVDAEHFWAKRVWALRGHLAMSHVGGEASAIEDLQTSSARLFQRPDADHVELDATRTAMTGFAGQLELQRTGGPHWRGSVGVATQTPDFEVNDLGFMTTTDFVRPSASVLYRDDVPTDLIYQWTLEAKAQADWTYGGERNGTRLEVTQWSEMTGRWGYFLRGWAELDRLCTSCARGGPAVRSPTRVGSWIGVYSDWRRAIKFTFDGELWGEPTSSSHGGLLRPTMYARLNAINLSLSPEIAYTNQINWAGNEVFGRLQQVSFSTTARVDVTFTPELTLEIFANLLLSPGKFSDYQQLNDPRAANFQDRYRAAPISTGPDGRPRADLDGGGLLDDSADFAAKSLRTTAVLRWEWMPSSTFFLVWQHSRSDDRDPGNRSLPDAISGLFGGGTASQHTFLMKLTYWIGV